MKRTTFNLFWLILLAGWTVGTFGQERPGGVSSNSVYNIALVAANTVGGPTNGVTAATAASIAATNVSQGWALGATNLVPSANITNGGWVMRIATNMYNNNSNLAVHYYPATNASLPGGGLHLGSVGTTPNASDLWEMWLNVCHDSTTPSLRGSEMQMFAGGNWAMAVGYGAGVIKHLQKGIGPQNPRSGGASWNPWSYAQRIAPYEYEPGYSWADTYKVILTTGAEKYPGFVSRHWTNDAGFGERWELSILKDLNVTLVANTNGYNEDRWAISNVVDGAGYYVYTSGALEGLYHRGAFLQSQVSSAPSGSTNVALDFGKSASVAITAPTGAWKFYTTNNLYYSTNYQRMVFLLKYTGSGITNIAYPSWYVPTNITLLTSLPGNYFYRLELESFGIGETNKAVVSATAGVDPTFYYDSDAQSFFDRAGGLETVQRSNAVNQLVLNLKATNLWTVIDAIYPFAGTTARINTNNLKSSSFGGVFTGTPAQSNGFVSDGTDDYMATGFIPSTAGGNYAQDSAHVAVYTQSTTMDDLDRLLGVYDSAGGIKGVQLRRNASTMQVHGPNNNTYTAGAAHGGDYTGFMCGSRVASDTAWIQVRTTQTSGASTSSALPTKQIYIGANNNDGTAASFTAASYRCVSIGGGLTANQMNALKWCMEQYVNQMP